MTMIGIALIAVAVFFIVICIVAVIVVKKESKRRTESLKAIEKSINKISQELVGELRERNDIAMDLNEDVHYMAEVSAARVKEEAAAPTQAVDDVSDIIEEPGANAGVAAANIYDSGGEFDEIDLSGIGSIEDTAADDKEEISFDFLGFDDLDGMDEVLFDDKSVEPAEEYITGRSGRRYTAEELEELIKE